MPDPRSPRRFLLTRLPLLAAGLALLAASACSEEEPFEARRESAGIYTVVHLGGSPREMGRQHARLLRDELRVGLQEIESNLLLKAMLLMAQQLGLDLLAQQCSYPEVVEECQGMADELGSEGWTLDKCLVLNFGDVVAEFIQYGMPKIKDLSPGCAQVVAAGPATRDGRLYHARILDWNQIDYIVKYPVIFVRHPAGGIPHVVIGFPGNLSPYQGMNAEGISVASNEIHPRDNKVHDLTGRSHVQMVGRILSLAHSLQEARDLVSRENHMSLELLLVADGEAGQAAALELAPQRVAVRELKGGVVHATNHFMAAGTDALDKDPAPEGSLLRLQRLEQLLVKGGSSSLYGRLDPTSLVQLMRDRVDPKTGAQSPADTLDDGKSLATNGALFELVFAPAARHFWVAAGALPVPRQPFSGFSLDALLGRDGTAPASIP